MRTWVEPPQAPALYHYCSQEAMGKILSSGTLWASDLRAMNDGTKVTYSYGILDRILPENGYLISVDSSAADLMRGLCIHVTCLSQTLEERSQWVRYAEGGRGWAIGFNFAALRKVCRKEKISQFPLVYDRTVQAEILRALLNSAGDIARRRLSSKAGEDRFRDAVLNYLLFLLSTIKNPDYASEQEWRLQVDCGVFEKVERSGEVCCAALPICTPKTLSELVLGPDNPASPESVRRMLSKISLAHLPVRRVSIE